MADIAPSETRGRATIVESTPPPASNGGGLVRRRLKVSDQEAGWFLLLAPGLAVLLLCFAVPTVSLLVTAFNPANEAVIHPVAHLSIANFATFAGHSLYYGAAVHSVIIGVLSVVFCLLFGYPLAYLVAAARTERVRTAYMIVVLGSMQLGIVVRTYGLMVILGNNGLINHTLTSTGITHQPIGLMYNFFGVIVGMVQFGMPFMVLSLVGVIQAVDISLVHAARSLGASRRETFRRVVLPMTSPGIIAGSLLVFALSISSYLVPALMGGYHVTALPLLIYQAIDNESAWQLGAALSVVLLFISAVMVYVYYRIVGKRAIGLLG